MTDRSPSPPSYPPGYGGPTAPGDPYGAGPPSGGRPKTSGLAVAGLVVGLAGFCLPVLGGLVGLILGIASVRQIKRSGGTVGGRGLAIAAVVVSAVSLLVGLVLAGGMIVSLVMARRWAVEAHGHTWTRRRFEETANALEAYHLDVGHYPTGAEGGLAALRTRPPGADGWNGPYLDEPPTDGWGHPLRYEPPDPARPGHVRGYTYHLWSVGPDGAAGTADDVER
ncbi:MAG: type II secretion system protein GspG [Phycisphaerae bacterium]